MTWAISLGEKDFSSDSEGKCCPCILLTKQNQNIFKRRTKTCAKEGKTQSHLTGFTEMTKGHTLTKTRVSGFVQPPIHLNG